MRTPKRAMAYLQALAHAQLCYELLELASLVERRYPEHLNIVSHLYTCTYILA
jgi:hypothetical protein